jgi:hypothetical protein
MSGSSRRIVIALAALCALGLSACSKGATTLDETENGPGGSAGGGDSECGNGRIDSDIGEECDGTKLDDATCETLGFTAGGRLGCDSVTCRYNTTMCHMRAASSIGTSD